MPATEASAGDPVSELAAEELVGLVFAPPTGRSREGIGAAGTARVLDWVFEDM